MRGRDPHEEGRTATTLELLFDLVFVVAFSVAGVALAERLADGRYAVGVGGFVFATFAAIWAWINFSWFASAFDTDDWFFRLTTLCQMVGVGILALGITPMFASLDEGRHLNNRVLVIGYVIMRVAMSVQWLRAAGSSPRYRGACLTYAAAIWVAQIGWIAVAVIDLPMWPAIGATAVLVGVEMLGPVVAENSRSGPTPWHAHHIAERYGALTIVTLGEGIVGTVAALQAVLDTDGWTFETAVLGLTAMTIPFTMWWIYFVVPTGEALDLRRGKCFVWGYGHMVIFTSAAAVGAGLHVAALHIEHRAVIGSAAVVATVAVPLAIFCAAMLAVYDYLLDFDVVTVVLAGGAAVFLVASVWAAAAGVSVVAALVIAALAPVFIVVGDEIGAGERRMAALQRVRAAVASDDDALA